MGRTAQPWLRAEDDNWYVNIRGQRYKLGTDKAAALDKFHELMAGRHDLTPRVSVVQMLDQFLEWVQRRRSEGTYRWYKGHLLSFAKHVGKRLTVLELKPHHVTSWIDAAHPNDAANTVHGAIRCVQRAMNWAIREGHISRSPVASIEKPQPTRREVTISLEQFEEILGHATDQQERDLLVVLWESGCRVQEIRLVEARHFDPVERRWVFPPSEAKGKRASRVVYLNDISFEITQRLAGKHKTGPIFRNKNGVPWKKNAINCRFRKLHNEVEFPCDFCGEKAFGRVRVEARTKQQRKAKQKHICKSCQQQLALTDQQIIRFPPFIKDFCAGVLRHTWITRALMSGVDPITVSVLAGHLNLHMVANRYSHLTKHPDFLRDQLSKVSAEKQSV